MQYNIIYYQKPGLGEEPWTIFMFEDVPLDPPTKKQSPFGFFVYELCRLHHVRVKDPNKQENLSNSDSNSEDEDFDGPNPFYSMRFLNYLMVNKNIVNYSFNIFRK